jgi:AmmeMemoRadiSam system protein A
MKPISFFIISFLTPAFIFGGFLSQSRGSSTKESQLTEGEKSYLLDLARQTLFWYLKDRSKPEIDETALSEGTRAKLACFVTLEKRGYGLRGCIGMFEPTNPLYANVISRAIAAATQDPRFPPVTISELRSIKIEISVLTLPKPLPFSSPQDLLNKLQPLKDGVILKTRYGSSTFLPQVWEQLPDKEEFLSHLCLKHGAPSDTWKREWKNMEVEIYHANVFSEDSWGRIIVGKKGAVVGKKGATLLGHIGPKGSTKNPQPIKAKEGTELKAGTIVTPDSDLIER